MTTETMAPTNLQRGMMAREVKSPTFWRDGLAEFVGTFMLVSVQCALPLSWSDNSLEPLATALQTALGMGFIVCTMAWMCADFSGGHFNPAVSVSMAVACKISPLRAVLYIVLQCIGAIAGAGFIYGVTPSNRREGLAVTNLAPGVESWQGFLIELWITCILVLTIFGATNSARKSQLFMPTIPIGFAVTLGILAAFVSTGASMNPARSLGPALVTGRWDNHWVYWVGPLVGGLLATAVYTALDRVKSFRVTLEIEPESSDSGKYEMTDERDGYMKEVQ